MDCSPPGSSVPGILQARILEWVAVSFSNACMYAKLLQSCPTLCDPIDSSQPGSSVPWILQARMLEWVAISFSNVCMHAKSLQSCPTLCDPINGSPQVPLSLGFSRQEYWSGLLFPSPMHACMLSRFSRVRLSVTPWTVACQAPLTMGFSSILAWRFQWTEESGGLLSTGSHRVGHN